MNEPTTPANWRAPILAHFTRDIASVARLTIVADPDALLTEPGVVSGMRQRGFEIIPYDDHVAFRYAYECRFRQKWDAGDATTLVVVLHATRSDLRSLPFDLVEQARRDRRLLSFSLGELFPSFAPHVLAELDRADLDAVSRAQDRAHSGPLGENATRDFLLRHVFRSDPAQIQSDVDLLCTLLRRHYSGTLLPTSLDDRFIHLLRMSVRWHDWPLERIVPSRASFFAFLQERWPLFLAQQLAVPLREMGDTPEGEALDYPGPRELPFDHHDVRVYIDNLFTDGLLVRTHAVASSLVEGTWMAAGVHATNEGDHLDRFHRLLQLHETSEPAPRADHHTWIRAATRWAELVALRWALPSAHSAAVQERFDAAHARLEHGFQTWLSTHYATLASLSFLPRPVMLHQIPHYLAHRSATHAGTGKLAVVVVDGLALDQWIVARQEMPPRPWVTEESGVFAWIPTLTTVSRQSVFAGEPPFFYATSLETTRKEEQHWTRFWENHGRRRTDIIYQCQGALEDDYTFLARVQDKIEQPRCQVAGIVVGTVDQMLHGSVMGTDGLHASVRHWAQRGALWHLLDMLVAHDFEVVLTADHGNVEGRGIGKPNVGVTADERGERVHVFRDAGLRRHVATTYPETIVWPTIGLPETYLALLAPPRRAFIGAGRRTVAHGGICLEEVIVPFVTIMASE